MSVIQTEHTYEAKSDKHRELTAREQQLLFEYSTALAPQLVPFCMVQKQSLVPGQNPVQLVLPMLATMTFQAAGFMSAEFLKRRSGEVAVDGLNKDIEPRE